MKLRTMNVRALLGISLLLLSLSAHAQKIGIGSMFAALIGRAVSNTGEPSAASRLKVDEALVKVTDRVNKKLPIIIDGVIRWDSTVAGPGPRLTYHYTILPARASDIIASGFDQGLVSDLRNSLCTDPDMQVFFKNGVVVSSSYRGNDGRHVTKVDVTPRDCGQGKN